MNIKLAQLKVENKGLVAARRAAKLEAIKYKNEQKRRSKDFCGWKYVLLRDHKSGDARYKHVAYSLLRGRKYSQIERTCHEPLDPKKLLEVLKVYDRTQTLEGVKELLSE